MKRYLELIRGCANQNHSREYQNRKWIFAMILLVLVSIRIMIDCEKQILLLCSVDPMVNQAPQKMPVAMCACKKSKITVFHTVCFICSFVKQNKRAITIFPNLNLKSLSNPLFSEVKTTNCLNATDTLMANSLPSGCTKWDV